MSRFFHKLFRLMFPSLCLRHISPASWHKSELRCPKCGMLIAYVFPLHEEYLLHITYPFNQNTSWVNHIRLSIPPRFLRPVPHESAETIQWELLREPIEPLMSDSWDDADAYRECVQQYIMQNKELEERKEDDTFGKSE